MDTQILSWILVMICCVFGMSDRIGERTRIVLTVIASLGTISIVSQNDYIGINAIETLYENNKDHLFFDLLAIITAIGIIVISAIGIIPIIMLVFFVRDRLMDRVGNRLELSLLDKSKPFPGGVLCFDVKYVGRIHMGYFTVDIITHFDDYFVKSKHYNDTKQCGTLSGEGISSGLRWNIPDDFIPGKCKVMIKAKCTIKLFGFFFPVPYTLKMEKLECMINEP